MKANSDHNADEAAPGETDSRPTVFDWTRQGNRADEFLHTLDTRLRQRRRQRWATATAGAAALVVIGLTWFSTRSGPGTASPAVNSTAAYASYKADPTTPSQQILQDGSIVELNGGADCAVDFSGTTRRIWLRAGIAHFDVAKAPKPFVVVAGGVEVRAVGTAFAVQLGGSGDVEVIVTEGTVAVDDPSRHAVSDGETAAQPAANPSDPSSQPHRPARTPATVALVQAGNHLVVPVGKMAPTIDDRIEAISTAEITRRLAWRTPKVEFDATPLAEAIPMINRYSATKLRLGDEAAGKVKFSGTLRANNLEPLLRMLESHYGLTVERDGDTVTLRKAPETPKP